VGNPGITYKYLGLRLFAHAWSGPGVSPLLKSIGDLNEDMIRMTKEQKRNVNYHADDDGVSDDQCSDEYNLTLINYMEPSSHTKIGFKDEAFYGT
jgi:FTO catalytic domain